LAVEHGSAQDRGFSLHEWLSPQEIRDAMTIRVPRYMVPQQVRRLEKIPLTEQGKSTGQRSAPCSPAV